MKVCFDPNPGVNFSSGWIMTTDKSKRSPLCIGYKVKDDDSDSEWCAAGHQALILHLNVNGDDKCGTKLETSVRTTFASTSTALTVFHSNNIRATGPSLLCFNAIYILQIRKSANALSV